MRSKQQYSLQDQSFGALTSSAKDTGQRLIASRTAQNESPPTPRLARHIYMARSARTTSLVSYIRGHPLLLLYQKPWKYLDRKQIVPPVQISAPLPRIPIQSSLLRVKGLSKGKSRVPSNSNRTRPSLHHLATP